LWATAKPFLEKWMLEQVGPQKFFEQLKAQAPHYAKLLPELPMLVHNYLKRGNENTHSDKLALELLQEQKRTNRMLQWLIAMVIGFTLGAVGMQILAGLRHF
jgi:ubiquinone biosynthesis protein